MAHETVRGRRAGADHDGDHVPAVAGDAAHRGVVPEHGHAGPDRPVLRHGHRAPDPVLRDGLRGAAGPVAVPEPLRGCRLLRQFPARVGLAGGEFSAWRSGFFWGKKGGKLIIHPQEKKKKKSKSVKGGAEAPATTKDGQVPTAPITAPAAASEESGGLRERRSLGPRVEEVEDSD